MFDHEKLEVYQLQLQLMSWTESLKEELQGDSSSKARKVLNHLDEASLSALLNTAEGNGKRQGRSRAKYFDDARGSATECAACLDALVAKRVVEKARVEPGKQMLVRIVSMLSKLVQRFEGDNTSQ